MSSEQDSQLEQQPKSGPSNILAIIAMLLALLAVAGVAYLWHLSAQNKQGYQRLFTDQQSSFDQVQEMVQSLQQQQKEQVTTLKNFATAVSELQQNTAENPMRKLQLAYAWLKFANQSLTLMYDPQLAEQALHAANKELSGLLVPEVKELQQTIQQDLLKVKQVPNVEMVELWQQLAAVAKAIAELNLLQLNNQAAKQQTLENSSSEIAADDPNAGVDASTKWRKFTKQALDSLKPLVRVRHNQTDGDLLLTASAKQLFKQRLIIDIHQAQWALLNRKTVIFQDNLKQVVKALEPYAADFGQKISP